MSDPTSAPTKHTWPRAYLLAIYNTAISQGQATISPLSQSAAKSLAQSLYRLRRRSDKSNASFITPAHHLVTAGNYNPGTSSLTFYYSAESLDLPRITGPSGVAASPQPAPSATTPDLSGENSDPGSDISLDNIEEIDPADFVRDLQASAAARKVPSK